MKFRGSNGSPKSLSAMCSIIHCVAASKPEFLTTLQDLALVIPGDYQGIFKGKHHSSRYVYLTFALEPHSTRSSTLNLNASPGFNVDHVGKELLSILLGIC
uniref:CSON014522 protein n=1 Tax=Culicoides sonorensis TaxID=179676 RepID=A0A336KQI2_CULSO